MPKYFSGRVKRTPQGSLTTDRYQYLGLNQAEPNLGDPPELENIPAGQRYQIVSVEDAPGKRFWIPLGGGVTPGSITIRDEGNIVPNVSASSSISDLDFKGSAVNVTGFLKQDGTPGTAVTITVAPPGLDHQVLFNDNGDFGAASRLIYDNNSNKVGIGSTQPEQDLDLLGNFKISGDLYDKDNDPGTTNQVLVKSATGGLEWADQSIDGVASAGGTITQVQYHNALGKVDGASNFVFDYNNNRVGIGSTQPTKLLDVLGESKFTGNLEVIGITTFVGDVFVQGVVTTEDVTNIDSLGIVTARKGLRTTDGGLIVVGVTTLQTTRLPDNTSLFLGSNDDLQLVHDGNNSIINDNGVGSLVLQQAGSTKLEVTGTGVTVTGVTSTTDLFVEDKVESNLIPDNTGGSKDLGSASNRWGTVYADVFNGADFNPTVIVTEQLKVTGVSTFEGDVFATGVANTFTGDVFATGVANTFTKRLDVGMGGTVFTAINQAGIGSVGIGTTDPIKTLHVFTSDNSVARFETTAVTGRLEFKASGSSDIPMLEWKDNDFNIKTTGHLSDPVVTIKSTGDVGIGTTNPDDPVLSTNTNKLAVGIVTANEFYGTLIGAAQSLSGGAAYKIPYQSDISQTSFIDNGTSTGQLLQYNEGSAPSWVSPLGLTVENATNVIGGIGDLIQLNVSPGISTLTNLRVTGISTLTHLRVSGVSTFVDDIFVGTGATVGFGSTAYFRDQAGIHLGDSEDLKIFHGTSPYNPTTTDQHSYIQDTGTGDLVILSNQVAIRNAAETEDMARFYEGDRVELRFDNTLRFQTTSDGVKIGGGLQDKDGELGTNGQLLSSTGSELDWVSPAGLTVENANKVGVGSINTGVTNATYNITVTAPVSSYYTLSGSDRNGTVNGNNQPVTLKVGDTINFNLSNVNAIHPFYIRVSSNGANVSTPAATGQGSTGNNTVSWTPNTAGTYVYQCSNHSSMMGTITVQSLVPIHHFTFVDSNNPYNARENEFIYSTKLITYDPLNGAVLIGEKAPRSYVDGAGNTQTPKLQVEADNNTTSAISLTYNSGAGAANRRASFMFARTADGTAVADNSVLGEILFMGEGNSTQEKAASIRAEVDGTPGTNDMPGRLVFSTSADGSDSPTERLRIGSSGQIGLSGANYGTAGQVLTSQGPNSAPVWDSTSASGLTDILVDYTGRSAPCAMPITISTPSAGTKQINIPASSNAYGAKYVGPTEPTGNTVCEGDIWYDTSAASGSPTLSNGTTKVAILKDQKNNQVDGGTFNNSGWRDRDLTVEEDPSNFVTFTATPNGQTTEGSGNTPGYWSLPAGDYKIDWSAPAFEVNRHKTRLVYSTTESQISTAGLDASSSFVEGLTTHTGTAEASTISTGHTIINLTQTTWFKVMHYSSSTKTGQGFGRRQSTFTSSETGTNIYTQVRIEDLATAVKDSGGSGSGISGITVEDEGVALSTLATTLNFVGDGVVASGTGAEKTITISGGGNSFVLLSEKSATGTEVEFTGIPADAMEITLMLNGVSPSGANHFVVQLGTSSGYITSGYVSNSENSQGTTHVNSNTTDRAGFVIFGDSSGGTSEFHGSMIINKASSNSYTEIAEFRKNNSGGCMARGSLSSVSGTVDRLKIKFNGSNTFDAGTISVSYKTSGSGGGHDANKIEQGNTKAEVIDTGSDGKFVVTTEGVERVIVDPSGYLNTRADIRLRRTGSNDGGIYFGDSQNNYIFGADSVEYLTFDPGGSGNFVVGETVTGGTSNVTATVKAWDSTARQLTIYNKTGSFTIPEIVTGISASWTTASFSTSEEDVLTFATAGVEKLRIKGITDTTYANCDDILLNNGGGVATTNNVTGVINMGSSYKDGTLGAGSGHWSAVKLHLWKNNTGTTNASTINNVYGLGVSNGMMEIQTDANLGFFVGNDGTESGSRLERMRINTAGLLSIGSAGALINESGLGVRSAGNTCVLKSEGNINHNPLICWNSHGSGMRKLIQFGHSGTYTSNGSITTNGTATYYNASSDYRMKQDEVLITDGIEKVKLLKPRRFKWKSNLDLGMCDGFFAHEIEEATPASQATIGAKDAVATESDVNVGLATSIGDPIYQQIDQSKLIPVLTAALKEAIAKIETLEARIAALEG